MASQSDRDETSDEEKEWKEKQRTFSFRKKAVFEKTKEADEELLKIRQEEKVEQDRFQQKRETKRKKKTMECLRNKKESKEMLQQEKSQSPSEMTAPASDSDRKVQTLLAEVRPLRERIAVCEQEHGRVDEMKVELETLRSKEIEQNNTVRKLTNCLQVENREKNKAMAEAAGLRDEILTFKQTAAETQQRQLSEIPTSKQQQQQQQQQQRTDHADVLCGLRERVSTTIDAQSVARKMFENNALTLKELESIQSKRKEQTKAAENLIDIVQKSDNVFRCFLKALKETNQQHVFDLIVSRLYKDFDEKFVHTQTIRHHYVFLLETLEAKHSGLVAELYRNEVLRREEREAINSKTVSFSQNEKLLSLLSRKTSDEFDKFLDALDKTGQQHVRNRITGRQQQESQQTQDVTQEEDVGDSYQSMQQRLKEANETIATLLQQQQLTMKTTGVSSPVRKTSAPPTAPRRKPNAKLSSAVTSNTVSPSTPTKSSSAAAVPSGVSSPVRETSGQRRAPRGKPTADLMAELSSAVTSRTASSVSPQTSAAAAVKSEDKQSKPDGGGAYRPTGPGIPKINNEHRPARPTNDFDNNPNVNITPIVFMHIEYSGSPVENNSDKPGMGDLGVRPSHIGSSTPLLNRSYDSSQRMSRVDDQFQGSNASKNNWSDKPESGNLGGRPIPSSGSTLPLSRSCETNRRKSRANDQFQGSNTLKTNWSNKPGSGNLGVRPIPSSGSTLSLNRSCEISRRNLWADDGISTMNKDRPLRSHSDIGNRQKVNPKSAAYTTPVCRKRYDRDRLASSWSSYY